METIWRGVWQIKRNKLIQNLEELFEKYKNFRKINNNSDDYNHRYHREVEIKIDNEVQCNCDLCKNENSYMKNLIEINKSLITGVNIDSLSYKSNKQKDIVLPFKNDHISYNPETKDPINNSIFNKNKTLHSFVTEYECIADKNDDNKKRTKKSLIVGSGSFDAQFRCTTRVVYCSTKSYVEAFYEGLGRDFPDKFDFTLNLSSLE